MLYPLSYGGAAVTIPQPPRRAGPHLPDGDPPHATGRAVSWDSRTVTGAFVALPER